MSSALIPQIESLGLEQTQSRGVPGRVALTVRDASGAKVQCKADSVAYIN
jgi:hypothetical protein